VARAGLNPERLAQAGLELADEIGLPQVTVAAVARRFHVKPASVYSHVRSSEDLRTRMALCALTELADRAAAALAGRAGKEALVALGSVYRDYAREHPGRYDAARHPLDRETALASAGVRNAELTRAVLTGRVDGVERALVVLNAGAALYVGGVAGSIQAGVREADEAIETGAAAELLERYVAKTKELAPT
jgi:AcrR family transcriptional regulator